MEANLIHRLRDALEKAQEDGVAIAHFDVADIVLLKAVFASAREPKVPVLVGASEGERESLGVRQVAPLVRSLCEEALSRSGVRVRTSTGLILSPMP